MPRMELRQTPGLSQVQKLVLSPSIQQSLEMLQLPSIELEKLIEAELRENPLLLEAESEEPSSPEESQSQDASPDGENREEAAPENPDDEPEPSRDDEKEDHLEFLDGLVESEEERDSWNPEEPWRPETPSGETLATHLLAQVYDLKVSRELEEAVRYVIYSLDGHGLLSLGREDLEAGWHGSTELLDEALRIVRTLEPTGVGCFTVPEALAAQLSEKGYAGDSLEHRIVTRFFDELPARQWARLARALGVTPRDVQDAVEVIRSLNPFPGSDFAPDSNRIVIPDVVIEKIEGRYLAFLNDSRFPSLVISERNRRVLESPSASTQEKEWVRDKYRRASFFLRAIGQRQQTVRRIAEFLAGYQEQFLEHGVDYLKPLTLQQAAEAVGYNQSTISRAINGKYVQSPQGMHEMRFYFSRGLPDSDAVSTRAVKEEIRRIIEEEDHTKPLSDDMIALMLKTRGYGVKRRTVANYREGLGIPAARFRKRF
jgi:RNA polymerase sigma-54 factor